MTAGTGSYGVEIAESARAVLERETPRDQVLTRLRSEPLSRGVWSAAAEVGWFRLLTAEGAGGLEGGPAEVAALFREIGRYLPAGPFAEAVVVAGLVRSRADLGPDLNVITSGQLDGGAAEGGRVSGSALFVEHADLANRLLLHVDLGGEPAIGAVDPRGNGAAVTRLGSFDLVGRPCRVELEGASLEVLVAGDDAADLLDRAASLARVAQAATLAGLSREVLEMSVQYAKDRVQFDRPIGAFQAVQHRLAEMAVTLGAIDSAVDALVELVDMDGSDAEQQALHGLAAELTRDLVQSGLQVHGGIGFTDEHRLHVYLKRALRLQAVAAAGDPLASLGRRMLAGAS